MYCDSNLLDIINMLVEDIQREIPFWNQGIKHYNRIPRKTLLGMYGINMNIWIDKNIEYFIIKIDKEKEIVFKIGGNIDRLIPKLQRIAKKKWGIVSQLSRSHNQYKKDVII